jgi:hypothetical protein
MDDGNSERELRLVVDSLCSFIGIEALPGVKVLPLPENEEDEAT